MKPLFFCKKNLFDWQFRGFGEERKKTHSLLLFYGKEIIGFRGIIPGLYQVPSDRGGMEIIHGGSLAMWTLHDDYRGKKLGLKMHLETQKLLSVITGAGSNLIASRICSG